MEQDILKNQEAVARSRPFFADALLPLLRRIDLSLGLQFETGGPSGELFEFIRAGHIELSNTALALGLDYGEEIELDLTSNRRRASGLVKLTEANAFRYRHFDPNHRLEIGQIYKVFCAAVFNFDRTAIVREGLLIPGHASLKDYQLPITYKQA